MFLAPWSLDGGVHLTWEGRRAWRGRGGVALMATHAIRIAVDRSWPLLLLYDAGMGATYRVSAGSGGVSRKYEVSCYEIPGTVVVHPCSCF